MRRCARAAAVSIALAACSKAPLEENVRPLEPGVRGPGGGSAAGGGAPAAPGTSGEAPGAGDLPAVAGAAGGSEPSSGQGAPPAAFSKRALRESLADCALRTYGEFAAAARALTQATSELETDPTQDVTTARAAWSTAMAIWQRAELFRFGPAARSPQPGALDLRDQIYAFPLSNYCRIDQQLVDGSYAGPEFASSLSSARGLAALEYLLFHTGSDNACSAALGINANGEWSAISAAELRSRRMAYAIRAARDVEDRSRALLDAWSPDSGDFYGAFLDAGRAGSVFASEQQAFNAVSDALLYLEKEVKDWKLGWPLGLVPECLNAPNPCPTEVESRYAGASLQHLRQNLAAFRGVFAGCGEGAAALGFDDWLAAVGAGDLSSSMLEALDQAQRAADAASEPLEVALATHPEPVRALHAAVKGVTDLLKTEFITVLDFELPMALEGDND